jgi:hypothetical protein
MPERHMDSDSHAKQPGQTERKARKGDVIRNTGKPSPLAPERPRDILEPLRRLPGQRLWVDREKPLQHTFRELVETALGTSAPSDNKRVIDDTQIPS